MAADQKSGTKRKRSAPYQGIKSRRKPRKFKKQEFYHSSSSEAEDEDLIPAWRNKSRHDPNLAASAAPVDDSIDADGPPEGVRLPQLVDKTSPSEETRAPITFADLVTQAPQNANADEDVEAVFDPLAPVVLSDDELSDETSESSAEEDQIELGATDMFDADGANEDSDGETGDDEEIDDDEEDDEDEDEDEDKSSIGDSDEMDTNASTTTRMLRKRNDPSAFAASIVAILGSKLTASKRADPILSRSASAAATAKEMAEDKLEARARRKLKADRHAAMETGRVKDVLGLDKDQTSKSGEELAMNITSTGAILEKEKQLKKTAQRGVVKLFNAVWAAQMKGHEADNQARREGKIGMDSRKEKVNEMSKKGFLDLLASG